MDLNSRLYSVDEVTDILGISRPKLSELCDDGQLHYYRIGRRIKISEEQLQKYLEENALDA